VVTVPQDKGIEMVPGKINVLHVSARDSANLAPGTAAADSGSASLDYTRAGVELALSGRIESYKKEDSYLEWIGHAELALLPLVHCSARLRAFPPLPVSSSVALLPVAEDLYQVCVMIPKARSSARVRDKDQKNKESTRAIDSTEIPIISVYR
jgi:hypothetical protein